MNNKTKLYTMKIVPSEKAVNIEEVH